MTTGFDPSAALDGERRRDVLRALSALAEAPADGLEAAIARVARDDAVWRVAHPIDVVAGRAEGLARVWAPLKTALPDLERRDAIFVAGSYEGRSYAAAVGHYCGTMRGDWLGIPATGKPVYLRYGEVWQIDGDGRAVQATLLWDVLDLMRQAGVWPLPQPLGVPEAWPAPFTRDGVRLEPSDPATSQASLAQTLAMHRSLAEHDDRASLTRESLIAMPQRDHWHRRMMWYGPAGIGTTRGLDGFVDGHQLPFRVAFQRPQGTFEEVTAERARHGAGHYIRIGDGPYSVTGGWPSVYAVHGGDGFCGLPATGRPVTMRVMDFYLHHEGLIRENWVPLDMLDLLRQMGFDAHARMRETLRRAGG
ncbi:nuclear transport factor 2 family protein [Salinarimonas chemoclinalis]|uniref:nuclear transport factor 2 family protein n=1 Tax=Salinarimonas chemoclinalis TaxID=3241599 RepID=UPI0035583418